MHTTAFYTALLALLFIALSFRVISLRRAAHIGVGDGGHKLLQRAIRVHGNFAEYVPFALLLMGIAEFNGLAANWLHLMGIALLIGRGLHAYGVSEVQEDLRFRITGMALTFSVLLVGALLNLIV